MEPSTLASAALQFPVADEAEHLSRRTSRTSLPKVWIGYVLAALCFAAFVGGVVEHDKAAVGIANVASLVGSVYWLYCIYRFHKVLAEATFGHYPISARRAVGFQLIPIYSLIWSFAWPKAISKFLQQRHANERLRYGFVGLALVMAAVLGVIPTGLHLALLFAAAGYLKRHIAKALPWAVPVPRSRKRQMNLAISAGLGAGYGFLLTTAVMELISTPREEFFHATLTIAIASLAAVKFVEPLAEKCRVALGIPHEHFETAAGAPRRIRVALFLLLVGTSASHSLLHDHMHGLLSATVGDALSETGITLVGALLFAGGITYSWMVASRRGAVGAALISTLSGAIIGLVVIFVVWFYASAVSLSSMRFSSVRDVAGILSGSLPLKAAAFKLFGLAARGAVFGLLGGFALRQQTVVPRLPALYAALVTSALLFGIARHGLHWGLLTSLGFALGWCAGLLVYPHSEMLLTGRPVEPDHAARAASAAA